MDSRVGRKPTDTSTAATTDTSNLVPGNTGKDIVPVTPSAARVADEVRGATFGSSRRGAPVTTDRRAIEATAASARKHVVIDTEPEAVAKPEPGVGGNAVNVATTLAPQKVSVTVRKYDALGDEGRNDRDGVRPSGRDLAVAGFPGEPPDRGDPPGHTRAEGEEDPLGREARRFLNGKGVQRARYSIARVGPDGKIEHGEMEMAVVAVGTADQTFRALFVREDPGIPQLAQTVDIKVLDTTDPANPQMGRVSDELTHDFGAEEGVMAVGVTPEDVVKFVAHGGAGSYRGGRPMRPEERADIAAQLGQPSVAVDPVATERAMTFFEDHLDAVRDVPGEGVAGSPPAITDRTGVVDSSQGGAVTAIHDADVDSFFDELPERTPAEEAALAHQDDYIHGREPKQLADGTVTGGDADAYNAFQDWLAALPADQRAELDAIRNEGLTEDARRANETARGRERVERIAPELLAGRLPPDQAERIQDPYALGIRQQASVTIADALELISVNGGLGNRVGGDPLSLTTQFLITDFTDPAQARDFVASGYYGEMEGGRFISVIPITNPTPAESANPAQFVGNKLPADYFLETPKGNVVNPKYIAGFLGKKYYRNRSFMRENTFVPESSDESDWL